MTRRASFTILRRYAYLCDRLMESCAPPRQFLAMYGSSEIKGDIAARHVINGKPSDPFYLMVDLLQGAIPTAARPA